ncbi:MAG: (d)CMP kinase [Clostridia bacterium]|nr:(d)CMP kinase [Clostridia bacterium]
MINIAVDGPSGSGKSSLAKTISNQMGILYLDTGALYRAIGYTCLNRIGEDFTEEQVCSILPDMMVDLRYQDGVQHVFVNGEDVSGQIRTQPVAMAASKVSAFPPVRSFLLDLQRNIAAGNDVIMDGRDVGTVILPNADVKIFLTADPAVRASRRVGELAQKGIQADFETVLQEVIQRDHNDMTRAVAPLKQAEDATLLDNSQLNAEETVAAAMQIIRSKLSL